MRTRAGTEGLALAVVAFLSTKLAVLAVNLPLFPTLGRVDRRAPTGLLAPAAAAPSVALLVPMRDEARRLSSVLPGLFHSGAPVVVFVDDESTDESVQVVLEAVPQAPRDVAVTVVRGASRPAGWVGKTWACAQLAECTDAEVLVFCDADVLLAPGAVHLILQEMDRQEADVLSVFCRQRAGGWGERLLVPLINDVVLCFLPFPLLRAPAPAAATASGALLAFRRSAYEQLGGHARVRSQVVEDLALARLTRRAGLRLGLALGGCAAQVRMYDGYPSVVAGLGRGLLPAVGGRRWLLVAGLAWHLLAYTAPILLARRSSRWAAALGLGLLERLVVEAKTGGADWPATALVGLSPVAAVPVVAQALRRGQNWKGRRS